MTFRDIEIKRNYKSYGDNNIINAFLLPMLEHTKTYKRAVGFFSSGVLDVLLEGIMSLVRNNGKIQLIASPQLSEDDINAIHLGYCQKDKILNKICDNDFSRELEKLSDLKLKLLAELIATDYLDIKIVVTKELGIYHDKLGILEDSEGNKVVFYGSPNSSKNAYINNYEKIRIVKSWIEREADSVKDEVLEFDSLWNGTNEFLEIYSYKQSAQLKILEVIESRKNSKNSDNQIKLRDYQEEAIHAWKNNNYHGFFVMATGTGKTWTAIYSAKELIKYYKSMIVICAPYKHLIKQWAEDVEKAFPKAKIIMVSSENPSWENQIKTEIISQKYSKENQIIIISTIASFKMERFFNAINISNENKLLIVDEAHRFTYRPEELHDVFQYMLGLSATPFSGSNAKSGNELMNFFGGQVFNLPIENALENGFLVPYNYYPLYVYSTEEEEKNFRNYTKKIISCFHNNHLINPDLLIMSTRNRLRVISMASEKIDKIDNIIDQISDKDHLVVYCGDGKLFDNNVNDEIRHIKFVKQALSRHEYKSSQFTATEDMKTRMQLVDMFNKNEISALAAIRCLDEGINIPSIKSALILSSNDDYREFVQRRGRILRTFPGKDFANIYDVIVLPNYDLQSWAKIELRRFYEYAKLSINWNNLEKELNNLLLKYDLTIDDINVFDYEEMEDSLYE